MIRPITSINLGKTSRALTRLTASVALAISLAPPAAYFLVQREGLIRSLVSDARVQAALISDVAGRNPAIWRHAHERLIEGLSSVRSEDRATRIVDEQGRSIVAIPAELRWPKVERADVFYESGVPAGQVVVVASLSASALETLLVFLLSASLGFMVYVPLRRMPARALQRASESLIRGQLSQSLVEGLTVGVVLSDFNHRIVAANLFARTLFSRMSAGGSGSDTMIFPDEACHEDGTPFLPDDWPMQRCIRSRQPEGPVTVGIQDALGATIWLSLKSAPIRHGEGDEYDAVVSSIDDITERKRDAERLMITQHAVMRAHDSIMITDADGRFVMVNDAFTAMTGYAIDDVHGKTPKVLRSQRNGDEFYGAMWATIGSADKWSGEIWNCHKHGHEFPVWLSISAIRDRHNRVVNYIGTQFDISERLAAEQRVRHLAHHDPLTGLPNRTFLRQTLAQALAAAHRHQWRLGLFFIDLDRFKLVNDTFGHQTGDAVLLEAARRIKAVLRDEDTVARLAGDEFVAFVPNIQSDIALVTIAGNLVQAMSKPIVVDDHEIDLSSSIGIAVYPDDGDDIDTLLSLADTAMYAAKEAGRSNFKFFTEAMNQSGLSQLEIIRDVRTALEREEFVLYFQPQVIVGDGARICGAEALIRWNHPERGQIPPGQFIPVIEGTRLIIALGDWVLEEAIRQVLRWRAMGYELSVSVNVSVLQVRQDDFIDKLRRLAEQNAEVVACIKLEVTESLMLDEQEVTLDKLKAIKQLGFRLSLDDFGTGYSSLAYLARFPFDELKIDRAFVAGLESDRSAEAITEAIILFGCALDLSVVAEGVETERQSEILCGLGCQRIQGYLYGRPMLPAELEQRL